MAQILFNEIPYSNPDLNRPGAGVEQWHDRNDVNVPVEGVNTQRLDVYYRFAATRFAIAKGVYNWSYIDGLFNAAIAKKQTLHLGIMTVYPEGRTENGLVAVDGGYACYPLDLHKMMQSESVKDWRTGTTWIPNYNSEHYLNWLFDANKALNDHIETTSFNGVKYSDVIGIIDIRGYGSWGEWHSANTVDNVSQYPAGTFPTIASFKRIVDAHTNAFVNTQLVCMIAAFDANWLNNTKNPPEIAHYILTHKGTNAGPIGWRRDQWGATDNYLRDYLENNMRTFAGIVFRDLIMERWKIAPITGEPPAWNPGDYFDLERQIKLYHATSFGNGNYGVTPNATIKERVRAASKACGYRFVIPRVDIPPVVGNTLEIRTLWRNVGIGCLTRDWDIVFELSQAGKVMWSGISKHSLKYFLPGEIEVIDSFQVPTAGTYTLRLLVKDPSGYRANMPLFIQGADANNSYSLGSVVIGATPVPIPNVGPIVNAGGDIEITLPVSSVQLIGSAKDNDGTIASVKWDRVSGTGVIVTPASATTTISGLTAGTSVFRLTATDNKGAVASDDVSVKVNPAVIPPPVTKVPKGVTKKESYIITYSDGTTEIFDDAAS